MTNQDEIIGTIKAHKGEILLLGVKRLGIFGSAARGEAGPHSDVDICVSFDDATQKGPYFEAYLALQRLLEALIGRKVDLVTEAGIKPRMKPYVERDLILVFA